MLQRAHRAGRCRRPCTCGFLILGDDPDLLAARDVGDVAGDREAALEVRVVPGRADDARVDELVEGVLDLDHAGLQRDTDLGCGEADARRVAHGLREVVEELVEVFAEAVDRLALQAEARVAKRDDGADTHGGEYSERPGRDRPGPLVRCRRASERAVVARAVVARAVLLEGGARRLRFGSRLERGGVGRGRRLVSHQV